MYTNALEHDLKAIFGVKAVRFERVETCAEQGVLCVEITEQRLSVQSGMAAARVSGSISIKGSRKANPVGFLSKQLDLCPAEIESRFWFSRREDPVNLGPYEWELKAYKMNFVYFYREEYNPTSRFINAIKWLVNLITGAQK